MGPDDVKAVACGLVLFSVARLTIRDNLLQPLAGRLFQKSEGASREQKQTKFVTSSWNLFTYVVLIAFGLYVVKDQQDWFWDPSKYHDAYPGGQIPDGIRQLYRLEISHYLFSLLAMFTEPGLKDFWAMASHHLFTLTLLVTSYMFGATKYGTAIMLLHDVADPWMECAKIALYLGKEWWANAFFVTFAAVFIYLRDYVYPRYIIYTTHLQLKANNYYSRHLTVGCLVALWCLHIFWTVLILKIAFKSLVSGEQTGDIREKDS